MLLLLDGLASDVPAVLLLEFTVLLAVLLLFEFVLLFMLEAKFGFVLFKLMYVFLPRVTPP